MLITELPIASQENITDCQRRTGLSIVWDQFFGEWERKKRNVFS
jgi:hypothetical protein